MDYINISNKDKTNQAGIVSGMLFSVIPFYGIYKIAKTFSILKTKHKVLSLLSLISVFVAIIIIAIATFNLIGTLIESVEILDESYYADNDTIYDMLVNNIGELIVFLGLMFISLIVSMILHIVTGISMNSTLNSNEEMSYENRYDIAKLAGVFLRNIPFYLIIKIFMSLRAIKSMPIDYSKLCLSVAVVSIVSSSFNLYAQVPVGIESYNLTLMISLFSYLISIVIFVLSIVAGLKLDDAFRALLAQTKLEDDSSSDKQVTKENLNDFIIEM